MITYVKLDVTCGWMFAVLSTHPRICVMSTHNSEKVGQLKPKKTMLLNFTSKSKFYVATHKNQSN
jgi:hypothetical protein